MADDIREELLRVKARESRYKKASEERIAKLEAELAEARAGRDDAGKSVETLVAEKSALKSEIGELEADRAKLDGEYRAAMKKIEAREKELVEARKELVEARCKIASGENLIASLKKDLAEAREKASAEEKTRLELEKVKKQLEKTQNAALAAFQSSYYSLKTAASARVQNLTAREPLYNEMIKRLKEPFNKSFFFTHGNLSNGLNVIMTLTDLEKEWNVARTELIKAKKEADDLSKKLEPYKPSALTEKVESLATAITQLLRHFSGASSAIEALKNIFWDKSQSEYRNKIQPELDSLLAANSEIAKLGQRLDQ